ncbi:MAG: protein kinase [archaeon]|nr:protein kinase [archaeon]
MQVNSVKNRILPLPEAVKQGLEPEPKIQDFEILKQLGEGSFGRVFLATHVKTRVQYAIKAIDKRNKANIEESEYFKREIEIMYKIRHPNVVHLYGHFEDDKYIYFIMEYVDKGNVYNIIPKDKGKKLSTAEIANLMKGVISAVYFLHNMNPPIIHRDIKPENVLLAQGNMAKLTDFGWSNYGNEQRETVCGTPIYLAPEIINQTGHDEKVDIWCIGVLLFELCTGKVPFEGNNLETLKANIRKMKISWPRDISTEAKNLISKILKFDPKDRLSLPDIMKHPFFTKVLGNVEQYLIKPDENTPHKPFIVSRDNPKDIEMPMPGAGGAGAEDTPDNGDVTVLKKKYLHLKNEYMALKKEGGKMGNQLLAKELKEKDAIAHELVKQKALLKEKEKKILALEKATNQPVDEKELMARAEQLEKENQALKAKCDSYEKTMKEQQKNPHLDKKINELRATLTETKNDSYMSEIDNLKSEVDEDSRKHFIAMLAEKDKEIEKIRKEQQAQLEKERKRYNTVLNKYDTAVTKLSKENKELKAKLGGK